MARFLMNGWLAEAPPTVEAQVREEAKHSTSGSSLLDRVKLGFSSDEHLAAQLKAGNAEALTVLFERHSSLLFATARRILRNKAEAEDATQQIFVDLLSAVGKFDPAKGNFKVWLLMFAYGRVINRWRHLRSTRFYDSENVEDVLPEIAEAAERRFPFEAAEAAHLVEQILEAIKPRQRRTIELIYYEGLTPKEVSERTGESVKVVRHNLYRGLEKMRSVLKQGEIEQGIAKVGGLEQAQTEDELA